jgi:putative tryptophan/tyrosine transport system substrate-binding protein
MAINIGRRRFVATLGSAVAWPLAAHAQQSAMPVVGLISGFSDAEMLPLLAVFRSKMRELGWTEGQNIKFELRATAGDFNRLGIEAGKLVDSNTDLFITLGTPGLVAVRKHSNTVPIVFTLVADPVKLGLIQSLSHPGGNSTGFTNFELSIGGKWLELLRDLDPGLKKILLLADPDNPNASAFSSYIEKAGRSVGLTVTSAFVRSSDEIESSMTMAAQQPKTGVVTLPDSLFIVNRSMVVDLATQKRLPAIYPFRAFADSGGLFSYGLDFPELYRQAAIYADKILRGTKPADLPVQAPNKYEMVVNLKAAKAIGLTIPPALLTAADEVIE